MDNLTDKQWKEVIKKEGCVFKPLHLVRGEYANTPAYLRVYISLLAKKELVNDTLKKIQIFKTEMNLFMFELLCASSISEKKLKSIVKSVRELRNRAWKEALKQAKGNEDKAWAIYGKVVEKID